jgi:hypothetical protein
MTLAESTSRRCEEPVEAVESEPLLRKRPWRPTVPLALGVCEIDVASLGVVQGVPVHNL